ncbi:MAG: hypothetical protein JNL97_14485, partial [Verrucomicrobiales bacterium]|nr:hypothetical protein [Verrucomicrobiales bacterium]
MWIATQPESIEVARGESTTHAEMRGVSVADVHAILPDRQGVLWLGTQGAGLRRIAPDAARTFRREDGLGSDSIHGLLEDREGRVGV